MLSGWFSGSFGRIEMRSSSEDSQLTMFVNRSRLPNRFDPARLFTAHCDVLVTINRLLVFPLDTVPAAAMVSGPFLPFLISIAPPAPMSLTATLLSVVPNSFSTVELPVDFTSRDRASGNRSEEHTSELQSLR